VTDDDDRIAVARLLGRPPEGAFEVVVRDAAGGPVVIRNAPLLDDGRPMPTRFWLVGPTEVRAVSRLEAAGGVRRAEAETDPAAVAAPTPATPSSARRRCRRRGADRDRAAASGVPPSA
jgi:hypothetical protein